jgi:hypothetical protein
MRFVGALLLSLAACVTGREAGEPHRWTGETATASPTPWNRDPDTGLAVRLHAREPFALGKPMVVNVEVRNFGPRPVQFLGGGGFEVLDPDGAHPSCLAYPASTFRTFVRMEPGASADSDGPDLAYEYSILEAGAYTVRYVGTPTPDWLPDLPRDPEEAPLVALPESPPLRVRVGPGELAPRERLFLRLRSTVPEGWVLHEAYHADGLGLSFRRWKVPGSEQHAVVSVFLGRADGTRPLGRGPLGEFRITDLVLTSKSERKPTDDAVEAALRRDCMPGLEAAIRRALEIP